MLPHRCFLSGGAPASSPSKSRVVEALCIHLCEKYPTGRKESVGSGRPKIISRFKMIVTEYHMVRNRLLYSEALLEGTNLVLYSINEYTLVSALL